MPAQTSTKAKSRGSNCLNGDGLGRLMLGLRKQWKRYRKELKRSQKKLSEEVIHDSRVGTRRLMATLELLGSFLPQGKVKKIRSEERRVGKEGRSRWWPEREK